MWSFLRLSMMISTTLVPSLTPGGSMVMLRMRSVRSQPVAPSSVAPAIPAPVILRKSLRVSVRVSHKARAYYATMQPTSPDGPPP